MTWSVPPPQSPSQTQNRGFVADGNAAAIERRAQRPNDISSHLRSPGRDVGRMDYGDSGFDRFAQRRIQHRLPCCGHPRPLRLCARSR